MTTSATEQMLLELINEARMNPAGNAARMISSYAPLTSPDREITAALRDFGVNGAVLQQQFAAMQPAQPLAFSNALQGAAAGHNAAMIAANKQSHQLPGELSLSGRVSATGYAFQAVGENVAGYAFADPLYNHAAFMVDWGLTDTGIQAGAGHRTNILNPLFREVGLSMVADTGPAAGVGPFLVTEDFGTRGNVNALVLGVAYDDRDGNRFYSVGEGRTGLAVSVGGTSATTSDSGGYSLETAALGRQTVTLTGAGIAGSISFTTDLAHGENIKLDVVDGNTLLTSTSGEVGGSAAIVRGLGVAGLDLTLADGNRQAYGTGGNDALRFGNGNDAAFAGAGNDTVLAGAGDDLVYGNQGDDQIYGNLGADTLFGGQGLDVLFAGQGTDLAYGNMAADIVYGNLGNDTLFGGQDNDTLYGGQGDDILSGDRGDDVLFGNLGADTFVFGPNSGRDLIRGFDLAQGDRIRLSGQTVSIGTAESGSALLALSGGGTVELAGLVASQITPAYFAA